MNNPVTSIQNYKMNSEKWQQDSENVVANDGPPHHAEGHLDQ